MNWYPIYTVPLNHAITMRNLHLRNHDGAEHVGYHLNGGWRTEGGMALHPTHWAEPAPPVKP